MGIPLEKAKLINIELSQRDIRKIYPPDWAAILELQWLKLRETAEVYGLYVGESLKCIGILFPEVLPALSPIEAAARYQFSEYDYLGYLFTPEAFRKQGWASMWFTKLIRETAHQSVWLSIENEELYSFYTRLGFKGIGSSLVGAEEYILYYD
jgi:hypothetical protein